jgi:uncharacterized membrane protein
MSEPLPGKPDSLSQNVNANIDSIATFHQRQDDKLSPFARGLERLAAFIGHPVYLIILGAGVTLWILVNSFAGDLGIRAFDPPPFECLQVLLTVAALATSTIVLITQQRQARLESQRAHLDLQVNLLTEQKVTKIIDLIEELRRDLPMVQDRDDPESAVLQKRTNTTQVLSALEDIGIRSKTGT